MNKSEIHTALEKRASKSAIQATWLGIDDDWHVRGKWGRITPSDLEPDRWDVWVCNPNDIAAGLTEHRVTSVLKKIADRLDRNVDVTRLDGEAHMTLETKEVIEILPAMGVRKARVVSSETKGRMIANLEAGRFVPHVQPAL